MNLEIGTSIHNRFIIEVRNKDTGELKQEGIAENIVLDRAYTRVCNFLSYFEYIHFGTGTGTLSPTRTTLFTSLGNKLVVVEEKNKAFPISKITKKITLAPEEYVGQTITEVGISETTNVINTHALIKDAEGNPLSIIKTSIDVVVIYATVYLELQNPSTNFRFTDLPNNNSIINYFVDGVVPSYVIQVGASYELDPVSIAMPITEKTGILVTDTVNKKAAISTRFSITEANPVSTKGNGEIAELGLKNTLAVRLPEAGIFTEHQITNKTLGTGDGVKTQFDLPNRRAQNLVVKIDNVITNDYNILLKPSITHCIAPYVKQNTYGMYFNSANNELIIVPWVHDSPISVHKKNINVFTSLPVYFENFTIGSYNYKTGSAITSDKNLLVVSMADDNRRIAAYKRDGNSFKAFPILSNMPPNYSSCMAISPDGVYIVYQWNGNSSTFGLYLYEITDDGIVYVRNLNSSRTENVEFTPDGKYLITTQRSGTGTIVYERNGDMFTTVTGIVSAITGVSTTNYPTQTTISPSGDYIIFGFSVAPFCFVYKKLDDVYVQLTSFSNPPSDYGKACFIGSDNDFVLIVKNIMYIYKIVNDAVIKIGEIIYMASVNNSPTDVTYIESGLILISTNEGIISVKYLINEPTIEFNTPPPLNSLVKSDYKVPYIPKTEDYVLDITFTLQFGEGV